MTQPGKHLSRHDQGDDDLPGSAPTNSEPPDVGPMPDNYFTKKFIFFPNQDPSIKQHFHTVQAILIKEVMIHASV